MKNGESNKAPGFGVDYKKAVSVRSDRVSGHGDKASAQSTVQGAFSAAHTDNKKA